MRSVELSSPRRPEPLAWVGLRPQIEIDDLRAIDSREPDDLPRRNKKGVARPYGHHHVTDGVTSFVPVRQRADELWIGCQRAVAGSDIRSVRHLGSMPYATGWTTRTGP